MYVVDVRGGGAIAVFDPPTGTVTARIPLGFSATMAVRPDGRELYAADDVGDSIAVISTVTSTVVARIAVRPTR